LSGTFDVLPDGQLNKVQFYGVPLLKKTGGCQRRLSGKDIRGAQSKNRSASILCQLGNTYALFGILRYDFFLS
jgi:hypothetical protein